MLTALNANGVHCFAPRTEKSCGPFTCPECHRSLILKKGTVVVHHFAHVPPVNCAYGSGETLEHMRAKMAIYESLSGSPRVSKLDVEKAIIRNGVTVRPDVRCLIDGRHFVGVEFQKTSLDPREIERRTALYNQLKVHVLWVVPWPKAMSHGEKYQPRETERYLHTLYFGRVYFWRSGVGLVPVRFEKYMNWVDEREYFDENGDEHTGGGYEYVSKRWVMPVVGKAVGVLDLQSSPRKAWSGKKRTVPAALLWSLPYEAPPARPAHRPGDTDDEIPY